MSWSGERPRCDTGLLSFPLVPQKILNSADQGVPLRHSLGQVTLLIQLSEGCLAHLGLRPKSLLIPSPLLQPHLLCIFPPSPPATGHLAGLQTGQDVLLQAFYTCSSLGSSPREPHYPPPITRYRIAALTTTGICINFFYCLLCTTAPPSPNTHTSFGLWFALPHILSVQNTVLRNNTTQNKKTKMEFK